MVNLSTTEAWRRLGARRLGFIEGPLSNDEVWALAALVRHYSTEGKEARKKRVMISTTDLDMIADALVALAQRKLEIVK